jgi:hypothetical protein
VTHADPKLQELVEQIHGAIRTFGGDTPIMYRVHDRICYYDLTVMLWDREGNIRTAIARVAKEVMSAPYWENVRYNVVRGLLVRFAETQPCAASADDIKYDLDPMLFTRLECL